MKQHFIRVFKNLLVQLIIFCFCFSQKATAQSQLQFGEVKSDTNFDCSEKLRSDSIHYGLKPICQSANELEIRLEAVSRPQGGSFLFVMSFNDGQWAASKYSYTKGSAGMKREIITLEAEYERTYNYIFQLIFDTIKQNNIFLLPNQSDLKLNGEIMDGAAYSLIYKVKDKFRKYTFHNIESFYKMNPTSEDLKNYNNIVKNISSLFN